MIRLRKQPPPQVMLANAPTWTQELLTLLQSGTDVPNSLLRRYAHPDIKAAVTRDSHGKCIYCESKILHITYGDVEHLKPKSTYPELTYEWENLGLVCSKCNNKKRDRYEEHSPPLNPFVDDPNEHLCAIGELIWPIAGSDRGQITIDLVELNRAELLERRRRQLERIRLLAEAWARTNNPTVKQVFAEQLREELEDAKEYAFVGRAVVGPVGAKKAVRPG